MPAALKSVSQKVYDIDLSAVIRRVMNDKVIKRTDTNKVYKFVTCFPLFCLLPGLPAYLAAIIRQLCSNSSIIFYSYMFILILFFFGWFF